MNNKKTFTLLNLLVLFLMTGAAITNAQTYGGEAAAVRVTVNGPVLPTLTTALSDTGRLSPTGGTIGLTNAGANVPSVLNIGASNSSTSGAGNVSQSAASVAALNIGLLSNVITANVVSSTTNCSCPTAACTGSSVITNLQVNGVPISVSGAPNQIVSVTLLGTINATLIINEQITSPGSITVNALRLSVTAVDLVQTEVIVAPSHSNIHCAVSPTVNRFRGWGTGVRIDQGVLTSRVSTIISNTGQLPTSGGDIDTSTTGAGLPPLVTTGVVTSGTSGGVSNGTPNSTQSYASTDNLSINALGLVSVGATALASNTQCSCSLGVPTCTGNSVVTNLTASVVVLGVSVPITIPINAPPNTGVNLLGLGTLMINEQSSTGANNRTVTALRVGLDVLGLVETDIPVAQSHSAVFCTLAPSAANTIVAGRVTDEDGNGLSRVTIRITDSGNSRVATTNPFGYYSFAGMETGVTYVVEAMHKRYSFSPQVISVTEDLTNVDFMPSTMDATSKK